MFSFGKKVIYSFIFVGFLIFFLFTFSRYLPYIKGPHLGEGNFQTFLNLNKPLYHLHTEVIYTKSAFLNGKKIFLKTEDRDGLKSYIDEKILFHTPYDYGVLRLVDSFGNEKEYPFSVWVKENREKRDS